LGNDICSGGAANIIMKWWWWHDTDCERIRN